MILRRAHFAGPSLAFIMVSALAGGMFLRLSGAPPASPSMAYVRVWKTELRDFPQLRVTMTPAGASKQRPVPHDLGNIGAGYVFDGYVEVPAGRNTLEVYNAPPAVGKNPAPHALINLPVDLTPNSFVTVLLDEPTQAKGSPQVECIRDNIDDPAVAQLVIRNLGSGVKDVHVTLGDTLNAQFVGMGGFLTMRGLRSGPYTVRTSGFHPDGKPFDWSTAIDLKQHPHQTVLICPDPYGHIRPRLSVDGEAPPVQPEDKEHSH